MLPELHRLTFFKAGLALASFVLAFFWKCLALFRARPLLPIGVILLWGGLLASWKIKALAVPGQIIWVTGFIMWAIGIRPPRR